MNVLKFILPLCLLLPSSVIISQKAEAQVRCTRNPDGSLDCRREAAQLEAACIATAKFGVCQTYHKMWCEYGQSMGLSERDRRRACVVFNLSRSNPRYFQQFMTNQKLCTGGDRRACNWNDRERRKVGI
jgi:hypothetical protein